MKLAATALSILFFAVSAAPQKAPLPKDLPPYGPETPLAAPAVKSSTLPNGLTVWLVSEPGMPKIALSLAVRGGFAADPADRPGITDLLSSTIDQGTSARTAKEIAQELQGAGGDLSTSPARDSMIVSTAFLSARADKGLAVFADVVQNATFPKDEVELAKRNAADNLRQQEADPSFLASRAMARILFGDNPYHVVSLTQEAISATTPSDLQAVYAARFRPDQAVLVAVGDFEADHMLAQIQERFGKWKAPSAAPIAIPPAVTSTPQHAVFLIQRPGSVQTTLQVGAFGTLRNAPDYEAAVVANAIYGGTFGSRLVSNIREDKGYTYSPYASMRTYRAAGTLVTHADVRNAVTGPTLNEITYELNRLTTTSPTPEELTQSERYLVGTEAIQLQSRGALANDLANLWINDLTAEEIGNYGRKIKAITADDVNAAARKYFPAYKTAIVAVGEDKVIRDAVAPFGLSVQEVK